MIGLVLAGLLLFNGSDLEGWTEQGETDWTVDAGAIVATGAGQGFLATDEEFGDFALELEFWIDATTNSGVFIRCRDRSRIHPDFCYELNIWDEHPQQEARTGAIVFKAMPPLARVATVGRWNRMRVLADGPRIEVRINEQLTATLDDADPGAGFLALQHWECGTVKFRNIKLEPLEH